MDATTGSPTTDWPELQYIRQQRALLSHFAEHFRLSQRNSRCFGVVFPLLDAASTSTDSLVDLCQQRKVRDGFVIARMIYETLVNACFVLAGGPDVAERAWRHSQQKALRDLDRTIELSGKPVVHVRWSGADEVMAHPESKKLLEEFTSRNGREVMSWTPESVLERLEAIRDKHGQDVVMGMILGLYIYKNASEIVHGTFYGALFALGVTRPPAPTSDEDIIKFQLEQCKALLMFTAHSMESVVRVCSDVAGQPELAVRATESSRAYFKRPK